MREQQQQRDQAEVAGQQQPVEQQHVEMNFDWQAYDDLDPYQVDWLPDYNRRSGILLDTSDFSPADYFQLYFPDEAFQLITEQTNRFALQFFDNPVPLPSCSRFHKWVDITESELKAYVALQIAMGLCQKNEIEDYWETHWLTQTHFSEVMSRNHFELISSFLHFTDNEADRPERGEDNYDPLWKIRPLIDICEPQYTAVYTPQCQLSIDESIIKFKGRLSFRQYLPSKPTRWGIKQYALCESKSGYALRFLTYCGKGTVQLQEGYSLTETLCLKLLEGFEHHGHQIFTDNFYTSPRLFRKLEEDGTGACGTVKAGRQNMPKDLHPKRLNIDKGDDPVFMRADNLVSCAWHDTKRVHFLSTIHTNNTVNKNIRARGAPGGYRLVEKPVIAEIYNQHMGGVDLLDQKLGTYAYPHKANKWYHSVYNRIREVALVNGYILYTKDKEDKGENVISPRAFRMKVIDGLLEGHTRTGRVGRPCVGEIPGRLVERHYIRQFADRQHKPDCVVCSDRTRRGWKRRQTNYYCKQCKKPMCFMPCHEIYHSHRDYKKAAGRIVHNIPN